MPFLEYILLAILGATPAAASTRTLTSDVVTQPAGGTSEPGQKKPSSTEVARNAGKEPTKTRTAARHHRRGHRKVKVYESGKKAH